MTQNCGVPVVVAVLQSVKGSLQGSCILWDISVDTRPSIG